MRLAVKITLVSAVAGLAALFLVAISYRYPTVEEILDHMTDPPEGLQIDAGQGDIGLFKVTIKGQEEGFIETVPQWVLPWKRYDWSIHDQAHPNDTEQAGTGQPATRLVIKPEGGDKPQPEAEGRSR
jgi:hypothetical protein